MAWLTNVSVCFRVAWAVCAAVVSLRGRVGWRGVGCCRNCRNSVPRTCGYGAVFSNCSVFLVVLSPNQCVGKLYILVHVSVVCGRLCCCLAESVVHQRFGGS